MTISEIVKKLDAVVADVQKAKITVETAEAASAEAQKGYATAMQAAKELKAQLDEALSVHLR